MTHLHTLVEPALAHLVSAVEALPGGGMVAFTPNAKALLYQLAKEAYNAGASDTAELANAATAAASTPVPVEPPPPPPVEPVPDPTPEVEPATPTE